MKNIKPTAWLSMQSILAVILSLCMTTALASNTQDDASADSIGQIHYHCATKAEGQQLIVANTDYYNSLNQMDLDWRMKKKGIRPCNYALP